jgi:chromosome segregation and condensation protein ScpB
MTRTTPALLLFHKREPVEMRKLKSRFEQIPVAVVKKLIAEESRKKNETGNGTSLLKTPKKATLVGTPSLTVRRNPRAD